MNKIKTRNAQILLIFQLLTTIRERKGKMKYSLGYIYEKLGNEFFVSSESISKIVTSNETSTELNHIETSHFYRALFDKNGKAKSNALAYLDAYFVETDIRN